MALLITLFGGVVLPRIASAQSTLGEGTAPAPGSPSATSIPQNNQNATYRPSTPGTNAPLETNDGSPKNQEEDSSSPSWITAGITAAAFGVTNIIIMYILGIFQLFATAMVGLSGLLLRFTVEYTVVNMQTRIGEMVSIKTAWTAFRDLANMAFIFIILYTAIRTILDINSSNTKKMIVRVVIIGLLINFSLFFTKVTIDASNLLAIGFYNNIVGVQSDSLVGETIGAIGNNNYFGVGIAGVFMEKLSILKVLTAEGLKNVINTDPFQMFVSVFGGAIFMLIAAFIFFSVCFIFLIRFIVLIFLMILSPLAFVAMALPNDKYSNKWWDALIGQCIFAPAFMALVWVSTVILRGMNTGTGGAKAITDIFSMGKTPDDQGAILLLFNYCVALGMLVFSLIVARQFGASGAGSLMKIANKASKKAGGLLARGSLKTPLINPLNLLSDKNKERVGKIPVVGSISKAFGGIGSVAKMDKAFADSDFGKTYLGSVVRGHTTGALTNQGFGDKSVQQVAKEERALATEYQQKALKKMEEDLTDGDKNGEVAALRTAEVATLEETKLALDDQTLEHKSEAEHDQYDLDQAKLGKKELSPLELEKMNQRKIEFEEHKKQLKKIEDNLKSVSDRITLKTQATKEEVSRILTPDMVVDGEIVRGKYGQKMVELENELKNMGVVGRVWDYVVSVGEKKALIKELNLRRVGKKTTNETDVIELLKKGGFIKKSEAEPPEKEEKEQDHGTK